MIVAAYVNWRKLITKLILQWEKVEYFDNKVICDLIEVKHQGIIAQLVRMFTNVTQPFLSL